jgi:hypothetical protein
MGAKVPAIYVESADESFPPTAGMCPDGKSAEAACLLMRLACDGEIAFCPPMD